MVKRPGLLAFSVFLGVFAVYAYTAYPTAAPRDSADLAAAVLAFAPAHPPGYPLYVLLGKAWLALDPWGDAAYRLNLMSAAAGAGAAACVFSLLNAADACFWPGLGAALALAFSAPLWKFSLLGEMYSLHAFFLAVLLFLAPGWREEETALERRAAASAFLCGLALVNHQAFVLAIPGLAVLWRKKLDGRVIFRRVLPLFFLGLSCYFLLWFWTGNLSRAWAILTRREYGTLQLSSAFARTMTGELAWGLLKHLGVELWQGMSAPAIVLAALGAWELKKRRPRFGLGLAAAFLGFGPVFFLLTRLDLSGWVARTVLEPALIAPAVLVSLCVGFGLLWVKRRRSWAAAAAALVLAGWSAWSHTDGAFHRDDFCAYDYAMDLRRALPPGSAAAAAGDTALYVSRYLDLARGGGRGRRLVDFQDARACDNFQWVLGMPLERIARLGPAAKLWPAGLAQTWAPDGADKDEAFWAVSVLRRGSALRRGESYARDIALSYAFAHYLSGSILDSRREARRSWHYLCAAALDPQDYRVSLSPAAAGR